MNDLSSFNSTLVRSASRSLALLGFGVSQQPNDKKQIEPTIAILQSH